MSREHNGVPGLSLAPWDAPCTEEQDTAAAERDALMAVEDAGAVVACVGGLWRVTFAGELIAAHGEAAVAVEAARRALDAMLPAMPWEREWTEADAVARAA